MFSWFRRKPASDPTTTTPAGTEPDVGLRGRVSLTRGNQTRPEEYDVIRSAVDVLGRHDHQLAAHDNRLELRESGLIIKPRLVEVVPLKQGIRTVVTVAIGHPKIGPDGIFEYQHSTGENLEDSIRKGFDQWIQLDLITLLDALRPKPESCTTMEMTFPEGDGKAARSRRAVLGPVGHLRAKPPAEPDRARAADQDDTSPSDDAHPFCRCCFLTNTFAAFKEMIEGDAFYGIRFFASRDADGTPQADCRVNGEDWEPGARAIREYVKTWPDAGFEFRKQYVVLQTVPDSMSPITE